MAETVRTVRLYGQLGSKFGRSFKLAVSSPAEAVQALCSQLPGFERYLMEAKDKGMAFTVFVGKRNIKQEDLTKLAEPDDIRIAPILLGSKNANVFQIIVGVILVVIGGIITGWSFGAAAPFGTAIAMMGMSMIIGGIVQMLMPHPKAPKGAGERPEDTPGYSFNGPLNTQAQGHPVPVLYGELITGSAVVSAGIRLDDGGYGSRGSWVGGGRYRRRGGAFTAE